MADAFYCGEQVEGNDEELLITLAHCYAIETQTFSDRVSEMFPTYFTSTEIITHCLFLSVRRSTRDSGRVELSEGA